MDKVPPSTGWAQVGMQGDVDVGMKEGDGSRANGLPSASASTHRVPKLMWSTRELVKKQHDVSSPWMQEEMVIAATEPWLRISSW